MGGVLLISLREFQAIIPAFTRKVVARKKICNTENSERLRFLIHGKAKIAQRGIQFICETVCETLSKNYPTCENAFAPK